MRIVHLALIRGAALLVPSRQRAEWFAEWRSELWYVSRNSSRPEKQAMAFCLGAFQDALWLRRNSSDPQARKVFSLESPLRCGSFLAVLAAVSVFFAFRLPGPRDTILPSPYPHARNLPMISTDRPEAAPLPIEVYQSPTRRARHLFTGFAFYQLILTRVQTGRRPAAELSVAVASRNLFDLLEIPIYLP